MHHKSPSIPACVCMKLWRTFFFFSSSAERSSLAFSWLLRFFKRVSGTRIWSAVGTLLLQVSHCPAYMLYEEERRVGIAAEARHSRRWLTRRYEFNQWDASSESTPSSREGRMAQRLDLILNRQDLGQMSKKFAQHIDPSLVPNTECIGTAW